MQKVKTGLIGYGFSGATFHAPVIPSVPGLELTRIASSNLPKVRADFPDIAVVATPQELIADPELDLVIITTPNTLHFPLAKLALQQGKHVVLEKPFVNHLAQADELISLARQSGKLLSVYHNRRWDNDFLTVKQCIASGLLGKIYTYESHYDRYRPEVKDRWREVEGEGSGTLYDLGSHLIDQALHLFGTPRAVQADLAAQRPGARVVDYFHLLLDYAELKVILHSGALVKQPGPRFQLHGSQGSFIKYGLDSQEEDLKNGLKPGAPGWGLDQEKFYGEITTRFGEMGITGRVETLPGAYQSYYQGIWEAITQGKPAPVSAVDARNVIKVIELAMLSHQERRELIFE